MLNHDVTMLMNQNYPVDGQLRLDVIKSGTCGKEFYRDMDPCFLKEIEKLTGAPNGIVIYQNIIFLIINASEPGGSTPVKQFNLGFERDTGRYIGFGNITCEADLQEGEHCRREITEDEAQAEMEQIIRCMEGFFIRAKESGVFEHIGANYR